MLAGFMPCDLYHRFTGTGSARAGLVQAQAIKENRPVLAVGTPGRLAELSREGVLQTHRTPALVLDEVDQLLAPNFREDLSRILEHTGGSQRVRSGRRAWHKPGVGWL